ncbi:MAG: hypothetical protein WCO55_05560 [Candidatus Falkowbacteria bacterium]
MPIDQTKTDNSLQTKVEEIKKEGVAYAAKLEASAEKKLDRSLTNKLLLIAVLGVIFMALAWLIVWYAFFNKNYDQCMNDCELSSIRNTDTRDCKAFCAKYK